MAKYNGSVELISGITQKNGQNFPLADASAIQVNDDDKRLDEELVELEQKAASNSMVLGITSVVRRFGSRAGSLQECPVLSPLTGIVDMTIVHDMQQATDCGFSLYVGRASELAGKKLIVYKHERFPLAHVSMNVGHAWGGPTFTIINRQLKRYSDHYWIADFDAVFAYVVEKCQIDMETESDDIYIMFYDNSTWELPAEEEDCHNYYSVYTNLDDSVAVTPEILALMEEIQNARVSSSGKEFPSLGDTIRHMGQYLEAVPKIPFVSTRTSSTGEGSPGGTMVISSITNDGASVGIDVALDYQNDEAQPYHIIRSALQLPLTEFDEKYLGKKIAVQVWASKDIDILWGYGYHYIYRAANILSEWQHLHAGYNEFILDTGTEEFAGLERPENITDFYINYLFGSYGNHPEPEYGEYSFRMSFYCLEDTVNTLLTLPSTLGAGFAGSAGYATIAEKAMKAEEAEHAAKSDEAVLATVSIGVGALPAAQRIGSGVGIKPQPPVLSEYGIVTLPITSETEVKSDFGFSVYVGKEEELRGKRLVFFRDEREPLMYIALNAGNAWGHPTYTNIQDRLKKYTDHYWVGDFDDLFDYVVETKHVDLEEFNGDVYIMFYCNVGWTLPDEGDEYSNRYAVYASTADGLIFSSQMETLVEKVNALSALVGEDATTPGAFNDLKADVQHMKDGTTVVPRAAHAENADNASFARSAEKLGMRPVIQRFGSLSGEMAELTTLSAETNVVDVKINSGMTQASDRGFSVYLGKAEELAGRKLILHLSEAKPFTNISLNAGASWGNHSYSNISDLMKPYAGKYLVGDFDELLAYVIQRCEIDEAAFNGDIYLMFFDNTAWTMPGEGEEYHNYYAVYASDNDSVVFTPAMLALEENVADLQEKVNAVDGMELTPGTFIDLVNRCVDLESTVEALKAGNVLWGKKYFATGDSFTQGDFSGWTDENGLSVKNSPVIYDSEWRMYKTYPWWIAKRNNMTLINDGICGSIMPLSRQYVAGEEGYAENYRQPFSLNRYKAIPEDVDYITLWFGINDSSNTNLGALSDTTNETYYGAWNVVMEYLITNYPYAKIGIIITDGAAAAYRQATREIAIKWGIPYLDMMGSDQTPVIFGRESSLGLCGTANTLRRNAFLVGPSNGHPNLEAHRYQSTFVEDFLRRL